MSLLPNTVINGNCLEVMKEIDDASIDMILCDLRSYYSARINLPLP